MKLSVRIVKLLFLLLGIFLIIKSGTFNELSPNDPDSFDFLLGMLFVLIALLRRIRILIRETF